MELNFLKKAKKNQMMAFTAVVCVVILAGYFFFFLSPITLKLTFLFQEVSGLRANLGAAKVLIGSMPKLKREIKEIRSKMDFYSNKLPGEEEFPSILENLSDMAQDAGVKIIKILPYKDKDSRVLVKEAVGPDIYRQKEILISAQCGYHQLGAFIAAIENSERFMEISDIEIEAGKVNPKRHSVQLTVKTFVLKGREI
ncbi:MAG: type 4a pilus biogenesis protein PilO [Candidatus Omnitrophota bacterium]|nr:type 4a pilus biogenesis protein PilO [Candidatus Omnitrophota bacterium]